MNKKQKMEEVKVFGTKQSQFAYRVIWALKLKGIPFEYIEEDLSNKSKLLLDLNPVLKKVPVLLHNAKPICESLVILEYIEQTWPQNPLLPRHPYDRATARFWANYLDMDSVSPTWRNLMGEGEELEKCKKEMLEYFSNIERYAFVGDTKFIGGESIGIADLVMGKLTVWLSALEEVAQVKVVEEEAFPRLYAWISDFKGAPVIKDNLPDRDKIVSGLKRRKERMILESASK